MTSAGLLFLRVPRGQKGFFLVGGRAGPELIVWRELRGLFAVLLGLFGELLADAFAAGDLLGPPLERVLHGFAHGAALEARGQGPVDADGGHAAFSALGRDPDGHAALRALGGG